MGQKIRTAVILGGSGAVGGAAAAAFLYQGYRVFLGTRRQDMLSHALDRLEPHDGRARSFECDVLDQGGLEAAALAIANEADGVEVVVNATGFVHNQGKTIDELTLEEFQGGVGPSLTAAFNMAKAFLPHMGRHNEGVIVNMVAPAAKMTMPGHLGHVVGCAGVEAFSRVLAVEAGAKNVRVLCLRSHAIADAIDAGSHTAELFGPKAQAMGISVGQWLDRAAQGTHLGRLPTLSQIGETIAFLASEHAGAMAGSVVNMTGGASID